MLSRSWSLLNFIKQYHNENWGKEKFELKWMINQYNFGGEPRLQNVYGYCKNGIENSKNFIIVLPSVPLVFFECNYKGQQNTETTDTSLNKKNKQTVKANFNI